MSAESSVSRWIIALKSGDEDAAEQIWKLYFEQLKALCRSRLKRVRQLTDEEDVALSALANLFHGAREGRFPALVDRTDLWQMLVTIASRKAANVLRWHNQAKRGGGKGHGKPVFHGDGGSDEGRNGLDQVAADEPTPATTVMFGETLQLLLDKLDDEKLRNVAILKLQAHANAEIAHMLNCSERTVERKLMLIRAQWAEEIHSDD